MADKDKADGPSPDKPTIVEAVGVAVSRSASGGPSNAKRLEAAMSAAVEKCAADGIVDPDVIREKMLAAHADEKAAIREEENAASAEASAVE